LTFLKNAIGQEIAFELERGGGARANLLATKGRIRNKLVDAAAMKVGVDLGLVARVVMDERERLKRKREEQKREREEAEAGNGTKKKKKQSGELHFLQDNLGATNSVIGTLGASGELSKEEKEKRRLGYLEQDGEEEEDDEEGQNRMESYYVSDETDILRNLPEDERRAAFQAQYKAEVERQKKLLGITSLDDLVPFQPSVDGDDDVENIAWEDG